MKLSAFLIFISCFFIFYSCSKKNAFEKMDWIEGKWENIADSSQFYESWEKISDSIFRGEAFVIAGGETVFSEKIGIERNGGDIFYLANVSDQNGGTTVPFKLISSSETELVFENKEHDFPNKITYKKISENSIEAKIEGTSHGKTRVEYFPFGRRKK